MCLCGRNLLCSASVRIHETPEIFLIGTSQREEGSESFVNPSTEQVTAQAATLLHCALGSAHKKMLHFALPKIKRPQLQVKGIVISIKINGTFVHRAVIFRLIQCVLDTGTPR